MGTQIQTGIASNNLLAAFLRAGAPVAPVAASAPGGKLAAGNANWQDLLEFFTQQLPPSSTQSDAADKPCPAQDVSASKLEAAASPPRVDRQQNQQRRQPQAVSAIKTVQTQASEAVIEVPGVNPTQSSPTRKSAAPDKSAQHDAKSEIKSDDKPDGQPNSTPAAIEGQPIARPLPAQVPIPVQLPATQIRQESEPATPVSPGSLAVNRDSIAGAQSLDVHPVQPQHSPIAHVHDSPTHIDPAPPSDSSRPQADADVAAVPVLNFRRLQDDNDSSTTPHLTPNSIQSAHTQPSQQSHSSPEERQQPSLDSSRSLEQHLPTPPQTALHAAPRADSPVNKLAPATDTFTGDPQKTGDATPRIAATDAHATTAIPAPHASSIPSLQAQPVAPQVSVHTPPESRSISSLHSNAQPAPVERDAFAAIDAGVTAPPATWIHAGAQRAEAGYLDPALGWIGVRAEAAGSTLHAAIVPNSPEAAHALSTHVAGLNTYLSENQAQPATITMAAPDLGNSASAFGQAGQGSAHHQNQPASQESAPSSPAAGPGARTSSAFEQPEQRAPAIGRGEHISVIA